MSKLIVIDGLDGCGKETQANILIKYLNELGYTTKLISFPDYNSKSSEIVKMYLGGSFGKDTSQLNPYVCASFYSVDRFAQYLMDFKDFMNLDDNHILVADRYLSANIIHQGSKIVDADKRHAFIDWCYTFECEQAGLPVEDLTLILTVDPHVSQSLIAGRCKQTNTSKDIHEANFQYLMNCYKYIDDSVNYLQGKNLPWVHLTCDSSESDNGIKSIECIHEEIMNIVLPVIQQVKSDS